MAQAAQPGFSYPYGVAVDSTGNLYVADLYNFAIRKITSGGAVSTLAGSAYNSGSTDGAGGTARFTRPNGAVVDSSGNVYVADTFNYTIRKITPAGVVSVFAGSTGNFGTNDGTGTGARFFEPTGIAMDGSGNLYVSDNYKNTIRKITPAGVVSTLAGSAEFSGDDDGAGTAARFNRPAGLAVDSSGSVYVADTDNSTIRKITSAGGRLHVRRKCP